MAPERVGVLYIAGPGRSGSTLVARLLGSVPGVFDAGELRAFWRRGLAAGELCGCGDPIHACPFWRAAVEDAFGSFPTRDHLLVTLHHEWTLARARVPALRHPRLLPRHLRGAHSSVATSRAALVHSITRVSGARLVVDSSKTGKDAALLASVPGIEVRVLHLVRDSRAVAYSWSRAKEQPRHEGGHELMPRYPAAEAARRWLERELEVRALRAAVRPSMFLRYEDFVVAPGRWLRRILAFAGAPGDLSPRGSVPDSFILGADHTVLGNPMRFARGETAVRLDDAWRRGLSAADRRVVTRRTWPLLAAYGYIGPLARRQPPGGDRR